MFDLDFICFLAVFMKIPVSFRVFFSFKLRGKSDI